MKEKEKRGVRIKIISANFKKGWIKIRISSLDDLWVLSQIITENTIISGKTTRRISLTEKESAKKTVFLKIRVEKIEFHKYSDNLRVGGRIIEAPEQVELHSYHTFNLNPGTIIKLEKEFSKWEIKRLKNAEKHSVKPTLMVGVVSQGECELALIKEYGLEFIGGLKKNLPGKKDENYEKAREQFYRETVKELERIGKEKGLKMILIGGNSIIMDIFKKYLPKNTIIKTCVISGDGRTGIHEIMKKGFIERYAKNLRFAKEARLVEDLLEGIRKDERVAYGIKEVEEKINMKNIRTLLVSDAYLQESRQEGKYEELNELMQKAEKCGGNIEIISTEHEEGKKLDALGGIAALLRY